MVTYFVSITDDKDKGWSAPGDDSGKILHTQGYGHVILKIQLQHMTKRNIFCSFLTSMLVVLLVVIYFCNGVNQIAQILFWIE
jgi:hypothetical protein